MSSDLAPEWALSSALVRAFDVGTQPNAIGEARQVLGDLRDAGFTLSSDREREQRREALDQAARTTSGHETPAGLVSRAEALLAFLRGEQPAAGPEPSER